MAVKLPTLPPMDVDKIKDEDVKNVLRVVLKYIQDLQREMELKL